MFRRHLLLARTGWLVQQPLILLTSTTPSAPSTVASQHSIDGAATPPQLRRGVVVSPKVVPQEISGFRDLRCRTRPISRFPIPARKLRAHRSHAAAGVIRVFESERKER